LSTFQMCLIWDVNGSIVQNDEMKSATSDAT